MNERNRQKEKELELWSGCSRYSCNTSFRCNSKRILLTSGAFKDVRAAPTRPIPRAKNHEQQMNVQSRIVRTEWVNVSKCSLQHPDCPQGPEVF